MVDQRQGGNWAKLKGGELDQRQYHLTHFYGALDLMTGQEAVVMQNPTIAQLPLPWYVV